MDPYAWPQCIEMTTAANTPFGNWIFAVVARTSVGNGQGDLVQPTFFAEEGFPAIADPMSQSHGPRFMQLPAEGTNNQDSSESRPPESSTAKYSKLVQAIPDLLFGVSQSTKNPRSKDQQH